MKRRHWIALSILTAIAVIFVATGRWRREPSYDGMRLSEWVRDLQGTPAPARRRAEQAIRGMGTNALPGLKKTLHAEDNELKVNVVRVLRRYGFVRVRVLLARDWRTRAALACGALGPLGSPAIPDLLEMCKSDPLSYNVAASAIGQMGEIAVERLAVALTNPNRNVRRAAAVALGYIGPPARAAVPALIKCLQDEDIDVCVNASQALGVIGIGSPEVVKTLIEALAHPDSVVRCNAVGSLATFGKSAKAAVPALLKLLDDNDEVVRSDATNALRRISPESAAEAGVK